MKLNNMSQFIKNLSGRIGPGIYAGVQGQSSPQHQSFLRQLEKELKEKDNLDSPLDSLETVVFDLETTGFFPEKGDRIISIGAVKMHGSNIIEKETFYSLIQSDVPLSKEVFELTKITYDQLADAPPADEVLVDFLRFIGSRVLVAHHSKHEQSFMKKIIWDVMRTRFQHRIVDTSFLIRVSDPMMKSIALDEICLKCGIEIKDRHHALGDAIMTAKVWSCYIGIAKKAGFYCLRDVYEHLAKFR